MSYYERCMNFYKFASTEKTTRDMEPVTWPHYACFFFTIQDILVSLTIEVAQF
jgi:hypothetical protein